MFSRGNATSGEPICNGMISLAKPTNSGVANSSSMIVPCIVNSWLNWSPLNNWVPGRASSARIIMAMRPPTQEEHERRDQVEVADRLVVSARHPLDDDAALAADTQLGADDRVAGFGRGGHSAFSDFASVDASLIARQG